MSMINRVVLVGRLTRDPELRTTGSGISVATFTLAVDRQFTNSQGERGADFVSCVIWRKSAENFCNFTSKGSLVGIDGRIQTRSYDNKDGQRVYVTEVVVDRVQFLDSRNSGNSMNVSTDETNNVSPADFQESEPQKETNVSDDVFADFGSSIEISDDDIAF